MAKSQSGLVPKDPSIGLLQAKCNAVSSAALSCSKATLLKFSSVRIAWAHRRVSSGRIRETMVSHCDRTAAPLAYSPTLRYLNMDKAEYNPAYPNRRLPECCFLEAGIASLSLPPVFNWVGPAACARCQQLQTVDLSRTDIIEMLGSTFAHCSQLQQLSLSRNLRIMEQEAFFRCASLQEVCIPPSLLYIARRAFAGCTQLRAFRKLGKSKTWRGTYVDKCEQLDKPTWLRFLPPNAKDQWREDFREAIS